MYKAAEKYRFDYAYLYKYTDTYFRLVQCRCVRGPDWKPEDCEHVGKGEGGHDEKLASSISRTKSKINELALCNGWDYFVTLTFNQKLIGDRHDLRALSKRLRKFINNYNQRTLGAHVRYLLIPEKHKDGTWHFHGLITGMPKEGLRLFSAREHLPNHILKKLRCGGEVYEWLPYRKSFGFCNLEPIQSAERVSKYITKYITKDLHNTVTEQNAHLYYASQGLKRKERVREGFLETPFEPDFENDYVRVKSATNLDELTCFFVEQKTADAPAAVLRNVTEKVVDAVCETLGAVKRTCAPVVACAPCDELWPVPV